MIKKIEKGGGPHVYVVVEQLSSCQNNISVPEILNTNFTSITTN
jgi:hypothetical protein